MNQPWVTMCPPDPETLSQPPSPPHPPGLSPSTGFECLASSTELHWSSTLHIVIYMSQCYSLTSSHPHLLPQSPEVCFFLFLFFFSSTSLLLPTHLPPPSCTHAQSYNPMDFSPPDSSVHGFFQARILECKSPFLNLCLFCCLAYRVVVTVFLNSTHMC